MVMARFEKIAFVVFKFKAFICGLFWFL